MFVLRSAFWLTVAFIAIGPKDIDLGAVASDFSASALAAGQTLIVGRMLQSECHSIQCAGGKAIVSVVTGTATQSVENAMHPSIGSVPFPRPRPDWMG